MVSRPVLLCCCDARYAGCCHVGYQCRGMAGSEFAPALCPDCGQRAVQQVTRRFEQMRKTT